VIVEDVVTTGGSTKETMEVARKAGAEVIAATAIIDRSGGRAALDVPLHALVELSLPTYAADGCPLCERGVPLTKPGSRPTAGTAPA
jgi:orotate phosphoribosyltransferase